MMVKMTMKICRKVKKAQKLVRPTLELSRKASIDKVKSWLGLKGLVRICQSGKGDIKDISEE